MTALQTHPSPQQRTLSIPDAGAMLGIGRATAYRLAQRDEFPVRVLKIGSRRLVSKSDLDRYLNGGTDDRTA